MGIIGWIILVVIVLVVIAVIYGVATYNGFVRARNLIQESWRQIDVELNRRYDLIPNLVETVRAYAAHERNALEQITALRGQAATIAQQSGGAPTEQRAQVEQQLSGAVRNLMVSVEAYPDLKSNQNFLALQQELTETEDRIANGRRYYNANVRNYNTKVESFPSTLIAGAAHFEKATYFEVNDQAVRQAPQVNFGEIGQRPEARAAEPTNEQIAQAAQPQPLPNPQAYQQTVPGAPLPGQFAAPQPSEPPQAFPLPQELPPAAGPQPPTSYEQPPRA